ncbi:MAG: hypothetical protein Q4E06_05670 [Lautropia sp.]|nr:hypothetical protein [Lautropia sp.]
MLRKPSALLTATALSIMLSGCSSAGQDGGLHASHSGAADTGLQADSGSQASPKIPPPAVAISRNITHEGILGEVLATMVMTDTSSFRTSEGSHRFSSAPYYPAEPWSQQAPGGHSLAGKVERPSVIGMQSRTIAPAAAGVPAQYLQFRTRNKASRTHFAFNQLDTAFSGGAYLGEDYDGATEPLSALSKRARGEMLMYVGRGFKARVTPSAAEPTAVTELRALSPFNVRRGERVPFNQVLQQWQGQEGEMAQLMLVRGSDDNEVRLCHDVQLPNLKRLSCSIWQVPGGWQVGQELKYKGIYVVDDRAMHAGEHGQFVWQTPASLPVMQPVQQEGISADMFVNLLASATMRDGKWDPSHGYNAIHAFRASPLDAEYPNGNWLAGDDRAPVFGQQDQVRDLYLSESWSTAEGFTRLISRAGLQIHHADDRHHRVVSLMPHAQVIVGEGMQASPVSMSAPARHVVRENEWVPFDTPLMQWNGKDGSYMQMLLLRDGNADGVRLCTNVHAGGIKRLTCSIWQAPLNWRATSDLLYKGIYVVDDSVPGADKRVWQTNPASFSHRR